VAFPSSGATLPEVQGTASQHVQIIQLCAEQQERKKYFTRSKVPTDHRTEAKLTKPGRMYAAVAGAATPPNQQATTTTILQDQ